MSSKKSHGVGILVFLLIIGVGFGVFRLYRWHEDEKLKVKENIEADFYKPVMLNDSTMHMNITESSCIMIQIKNDTVFIDSHNASTVNYNKATHELMVVKTVKHDVGKWEHTVKEINLDTIFKNVPNEYFFIGF